ncbi:MAG: hypothetical protein ABJD70_04145 [Halioglobus sp.]
MTHLAKFLSPSGIMVATLQGRWSELVHETSPYIGEDRWQTILGQYNSCGHVYCNYIKEESHEFISGSYGVSLVKPHIAVKMVEKIPDVRIFLYQERAWADHQDVVVFGRPAFELAWLTSDPV